jgi:hypothetical protein
LVKRDVSGELKKGDYLLTGIHDEKVVNRNASFKKVKEGLDGYARTGKAGRTVHDLAVDSDNFR